MKKLGVIFSFVIALGSLVLLADALVDEPPPPPTPTPVEERGNNLEPVITITDIPVAAAFEAPVGPPQTTLPAQPLDDAAVVAARAKSRGISAA